MRIMMTMLLFCLATPAWAQEATKTKVKGPQRGRSAMSVVADPFAEQEEMDMGGYDGMDEMGMAMGMMEAAEPGPDPEAEFQAGLSRAIVTLKQSKDEKKREKLRGFIRDAFEKRYDRLMAQRKKDIDRIRESLNKLQSDLQRRTEAKDRVVGSLQISMQPE